MCLILTRNGDNMDRMELTIKYSAGHSSKETWTKSDYHCPSCAQKSVWVGDGDDYYAGKQFICIGCDRSFYFYQEPCAIGLNKSADISRLFQLKLSVATPLFGLHGPPVAKGRLPANVDEDRHRNLTHAGVHS